MGDVGASRVETSEKVNDFGSDRLILGRLIPWVGSWGMIFSAIICRKKSRMADNFRALVRAEIPARCTLSKKDLIWFFVTLFGVET